MSEAITAVLGNDFGGQHERREGFEQYKVHRGMNLEYILEENVRKCLQAGQYTIQEALEEKKSGWCC